MSQRMTDEALQFGILDEYLPKATRSAYLAELIRRVRDRDDTSNSTLYWELIEQGKSASEAVRIIKVYQQLLADTSLDKVEF